MRHVLPIYLSNINISVIKKTAVKTPILTFKLEDEIIKGFDYDDFIKRNQEYLFNKASKKQKIPTSKEFEISLRIDGISLLRQIGWGVED